MYCDIDFFNCLYEMCLNMFSIDFSKGRNVF